MTHPHAHSFAGVPATPSAPDFPTGIGPFCVLIADEAVDRLCARVALGSEPMLQILPSASPVRRSLSLQLLPSASCSPESLVFANRVSTHHARTTPAAITNAPNSVIFTILFAPQTRHHSREQDTDTRRSSRPANGF